MNAYKVKEIYYTLQGEGNQAGRAAVFCRFSGCNLWSGREEDRAKAICQFCDTDFWGMDGVLGGKFTAAELTDVVSSLWPKNNNSARPYIVCTGGEPMLQLDETLIDHLHQAGFEIAIETNGTILVPDSVDWICVSPKAGAPIVQNKGQELKLVFPQQEAIPEQFVGLDFEHFYLQPMDGPNVAVNTKLAIEYCKHNPIWKLSIQTHKILQIP
jgi:7-carboxy-7-deazaguanine synthase